MILYCTISFVLGYFTYPLVSMFNEQVKRAGERKEEKRIQAKKRRLLEMEKIRNSIRNRQSPQKKKPTQKKFHLDPKYHGYDGGFDLITKCQDPECGMIALYEDQHPAKPCQFCGAKVKEHGAGKWEEMDGQYQWNTRMPIHNGKEEKE